MRPSFIGHYTDFLDDDSASYPGTTELLSIGSAVGKNLGLKKIGIHIESILSGRRTSFPHAESAEEEFAFVIEGNPDVWIDGVLHPLRPGDFVAFPAGTGMAHTFINNASYPAKLLVGGDRPLKENKIFYALDEEQNERRRERGDFWENAPRNPLGPHNGRPDHQTNLKWNLPQLETDRLILRAVELTDAPSIYKYAHDQIATQFVTWDPHQSVTDSENYIKSFVHPNYCSGVLTYAICLKENPQEMLGDVSAFFVSRPNKVMELGTILRRDHWGKGIVVEALNRLIQHCWQTQDVVRIQSRCFKENGQSFRMMEKLGMKYEGQLARSLYCKNQSWDMEVFSLTK
jgi:uncharacterized cupin superfamily protein/RimJ/RimL family protein N-acetyltransferase